VYDVGANAGWVSVGITSDTAQFAVASIRRWLDAMGRERYSAILLSCAPVMDARYRAIFGPNWIACVDGSS
jgi:hypothetical protein